MCTRFILCSSVFIHTQIRAILSEAVSPHFSHTCSPRSYSVFLLLQNISFPEWGWNISFCFSGLLTLLTKSLLTHLRSQIYCSLTAAVNCTFFLKPRSLFHIDYNFMRSWPAEFYVHLSSDYTVDNSVFFCPFFFCFDTIQVSRYIKRGQVIIPFKAKSCFKWTTLQNT